MLIANTFSQSFKTSYFSRSGYATKVKKIKKKKVVKKFKVPTKEVKEKTLAQRIGFPSDPVEEEYSTYVRAALDKGVVPTNEALFIEFFDRYARRIKQETAAEVYGLMAEYNVVPTISLFESMVKSCQDMNFLTQLVNHMTRNRVYITPKILSALRYDTAFFDPFENDTGSEFAYQLIGYFDKVGANVPTDTVTYMIRYFKTMKLFGAVDQIFMILCANNHTYIENPNALNSFINNAIKTEDAIQGMTLYAKLRELGCDPTPSQIYKFRKLFVNYPDYLEKLRDDETKYNEKLIAQGLRPIKIGGDIPVDDAEFDDDDDEMAEWDNENEDDLDDDEKAYRDEYRARKRRYLERKQRAENLSINQTGTRKDREFTNQKPSRVDREDSIQATNLD